MIRFLSNHLHLIQMRRLLSLNQNWMTFSVSVLCVEGSAQLLTSHMVQWCQLIGDVSVALMVNGIANHLLGQPICLPEIL